MFQGDYESIKDTGIQVTSGRHDDPQYMFLAQRLQALDQGWEELNKMWENRNKVLMEAQEFQTFVKDCTQVLTLIMKLC